MDTEKLVIADNRVVAMNYTLSDSEGTVIDQSDQGSPLLYLHGHQNIVPGLERELTGMKAGESKLVVVSPEEGYGTREEEMVLKVPLSELPSDLKPEVGMTIGMETEQGHTVPVRIAQVAADHVQLDANHELAGITLHFDISIEEVRDASEEELTHGHVHGPGGHHH